MNKFLLLATAATALVGGCATTPAPTTSYAQDDSVDFRKVAAIDRLARARGVEVHWVNYPQRRGIVSDPGAPTGT